MKRFEVLDSWRGIAACMVALYHFPANSHIYSLGLLRHAFLFVDLFFVLSGFVIAANYQARLAADFGIGRFMWLRLGRLYPLHVAVLTVFVIYRGIEAAIPTLGAMAHHRPFGLAEESFGAIIANLTLTHGLHLFEVLTWNYPSWSISVEFFTYFIFAGAVITLRDRLWVGLCMAAIASATALWALTGDIGATYDYGLLRCIYGFSVGALTWRIIGRLGPTLRGTLMEVAAVGIMLLFVSSTGWETPSLLAPIVFAVLVATFSSQTGVVSKVLMNRGLVFLGTLSYSIYMLHAFVVWRVVGAARHFAPGEIVHERFGAKLWHGDLAYAAYLIFVIGAAWLSYKLIEAPSRAWFRARLHARDTSLRSEDGTLSSAG